MFAELSDNTDKQVCMHEDGQTCLLNCLMIRTNKS